MCDMNVQFSEESYYDITQSSHYKDFRYVVFSRETTDNYDKEILELNQRYGSVSKYMTRYITSKFFLFFCFYKNYKTFLIIHFFKEIGIIHIPIIIPRIKQNSSYFPFDFFF